MRYLRFALFVAITLIGMAGISTLFYHLGLRTGPVGTRLIFLSFLGGALLFLISIILSRKSLLGGVLYTLIQIASACGFYLFIGSLGLGVILLIGALTGITIGTGVAWCCVAAAALLTITGFIQATLFSTTTYTVSLPGAPAAWNQKTAVLVSDTHFGLINKARFSQKIVRAITALHPDFVLHAGDFYDGPMIDLAVVTAPWRTLASTTPVFFAPGNHETYGDYAAFLASLRAVGMTTLEDQVVVHDGVQIAGVRYRAPNAAPADATALTALHLDPHLPAILINHPPTFQSQSRAAGIALMVSGHTHRGQFWPLNVITRMIYGKYDYGMQSENGLTTITTRGVGTWGPPLRLWNRPELVVIRFRTTPDNKKG